MDATGSTPRRRHEEVQRGVDHQHLEPARAEPERARHLTVPRRSADVVDVADARTAWPGRAALVEDAITDHERDIADHPPPGQGVLAEHRRHHVWVHPDEHRLVGDERHRVVDVVRGRDETVVLRRLRVLDAGDAKGRARRRPRTGDERRLVPGRGHTGFRLAERPTGTTGSDRPARIDRQPRRQPGQDGVDDGIQRRERFGGRHVPQASQLRKWATSRSESQARQAPVRGHPVA